LVLAVQKQMELTRDYFAPDKAAGEKTRDLGIVDPVQWHLQAMKQELADVKVSLQALTRLIDGEQNNVGELIRYRSREQDYEKEVEYARKNLDPAIQRLNEIRQVRELGGFDAEVIAPPQPGVPIGPFIFNYLVLGGFFGLLSGLGLAYVADM